MALSDFTIAVLLVALPFSGFAFSLYTSYTKWKESPFRKTRLPPGPPASQLQLGKEVEVLARPWTKYLEWSKKYGNMIYFKLFNGDQIIVLHSKTDAVELLDKRSVVYSSRPKAVITDLMGWDFDTTTIPYGTEWRAHRKLYQQCFRPKAVPAYASIQTEKTHAMLKAILETPKNFRTHCRSAMTGTLMSLLYGRELTPETIEYFTHMVDEATSKLVETLIPGTNAPNVVPFTQYLPSWFPGADFKRAALEVRQLTQQMVEAPIDFVGQGLLQGTSSQSLLSDLLENCYVEREYKRIKKVAATTYSAGAHTMTSSLLTFFLCMAKFPGVQKKAQMEVDKIVGSGRLPTFADRSSLPYVEAVYREVLRWRPPQPLNTAHTTTDADIYDNFEIPKGSQIIANIWAMTRNEQDYPQPELFNPDRFMKDGTLQDDNIEFVFGFGRRICPGRHLASSTLWIMIVSTLATLNIAPVKDDDLDVEYSNSLVSYPGPFDCSITSRTSNVASLIDTALSKKSSPTV